MKAFVIAVSVAGLMSAAILVYSPAPAEAIPGPQAACSEVSAPTSSPNYIPVPGLTATINNGAVTRNVVVQFAADVGVSAGSAGALAYSIDGGPYGLRRSLTILPSGSQATLDVFTLGPGVHTIQPGWRIEGGGNGNMEHRCLIVEGRTK